MTGITDLCHPETVRVAPSHQAEAAQIAAEIAAIAATGGSATCSPGSRPSAPPPLEADPRWQRKPRQAPTGTSQTIT
jgi:hypothetical protein